MPGSYSLPNPGSPATSDPLTSLPIRQNFQSIQSQLNNADGAALQAKTVTEQALADAINPRLALTNAKVSYVVSGFVIAPPGSGLVLTIPAGVAYVNGYYVNYLGGSITVTANQDTYIDISTTGTISQPSVPNNTASQTLTANSLRLAKVVANANIVQVLQHTPNYSPVSPNTQYWSGYDTLGNPVAPTSILPAGSVDANELKGAKLFGLGGGLFGTGASLATNFLIQAGSGTASTGTTTISFPAPFINGLLTVVVSNGDGAANSGYVNTTSYSLSSFQIASSVGGTYRYNWIAIGW